MYRSPEDAKKIANQIISTHEGKQKWSDPDFPCSPKSLFRRKPQNQNITTWKRPEEISQNPNLFVDGVESGDVIQGELGDCYFLGAISVLATRRDLLLPLFETKRPLVGLYQIRFFKNGEWVVVTIDDRLPVNSQNQLVFAHCKDKNEMWVPLIEKAYAKLHNYYEATESGSIASALMDLTGEASQSFDFAHDNLVSSDKLWSMLLEFEKEKFLMGCSCHRGGIESDTGMGILGNHAYSVLQCVQVSTKDRLIRLRNPWGCKEWTGRWSDGSKEWTTALKTKLNFEFSEDGTFFMCYEDFVKQFDNLFVCRLLTDQVGHLYQHLMYHHDWNRQTGGGCSNHDSWKHNDQWAITVAKKTEVFICVMQPDRRILDGKEDYTISIGFNIYFNDNSRKLLSPEPEKLFHKCNYAPSRHVSSLVTLDPGQYILVPTTYDPGHVMSYYMHLFSYYPIKVDLIGDGPGNAAAFVAGKWTGKTAGGCFNHQTWINNPKYLLKFGKNSGNAEVEFNLIQGNQVTHYIGLYIFGGYQDGKGLTTNQCVKQLQCTNKTQISLSVSLPLQGQFVVMPITFTAGETNDFQLFIQTKETLSLFELDGDAKTMIARKLPDYVSKVNTKPPSGYARVGGKLSIIEETPPRKGPSPAPAPQSPSPARTAPATKPPVTTPTKTTPAQVPRRTAPVPKPYVAPQPRTSPPGGVQAKPYTPSSSKPQVTPTKPAPSGKVSTTVVTSPKPARPHGAQIRTPLNTRKM